MIRTIVVKELREVIRDGRLRLLGGLVVILALAALAFGVEQTRRAQQTREDARTRAQSQWENQGEKNPHVAAHYGTYVFAPTNAVTAVDPGVSAYLGRVVKLEAHQRSLADHSAAEDGGASGQFSVATVLYLLVPLLIVALGYGVWSLERERGTLRQVLSTQVDRRSLFWGKAIALAAAVAMLLLPAALIVLIVLWTTGGGNTDTLARLGTLSLAVSLYWGAFGGLTLLASAVSRTSRSALVTMVGVWGVFCLVTPRIGTELSGVIQPLPSRAELARAVGKSLESGVDGATSRDVAVEAIVTDMMAEQGFDATGLLVDEGYLAGLELQAEAKWEDQVFDHHVLEVDNATAQQEAVAAYAGFVSPFVAIRTLSAGLCGTDFFHHRHFTEAAENYRKLMVAELNRAFAENAGVDGWEYKAGPELWAKLPAFQYTPPTLSDVLAHHRVSLGALAFWFLLALGFARAAANRVRVV